jgi:hypothetical protein
MARGGDEGIGETLAMQKPAKAAARYLLFMTYNSEILKRSVTNETGGDLRNNFW